jgi:hypothetical protein
LNGHDRIKPDGLNYRKVNKNYGGKQMQTRDSVLTDERCFGNYHNASFFLQLRSTQRMTYSDNDKGPFHLSDDKKQQTKYN